MSTRILRILKNSRVDHETGKRIIDDMYDVELELQANGQPTAAVSRKVFKSILDMVATGGWIEISAYEIKPKPKISDSDALQLVKNKINAYLSSKQQTTEVKAARMRVAKTSKLTELEDNASIFQGLPLGRQIYGEVSRSIDTVRAEYEVLPPTSKNNPSRYMFGFEVGDRVRHKHRVPRIVGTVRNSSQFR
jgi:hypothetical protein